MAAVLVLIEAPTVGHGGGSPGCRQVFVIWVLFGMLKQSWDRGQHVVQAEITSGSVQAYSFPIGFHVRKYPVSTQNCSHDS